ncbi:YaaA family protein [Lysinibacter cavernae]|uniref:Peroxide stress protein YaaA n=1 Tax=Lysinibacter cavernae TaxID=1640652 RepID=A0A7X5TUH7_9MICO|nr:peroxide stress protein YaaA [Lysinibacter cavernae]NIH55315.1 hypothetical protein [Lysinibacter cavernae]
MKILLPPSETKVSGGEAGPLQLSGLASLSLSPEDSALLLKRRESLVEVVVSLAADVDESQRVLKLGPKQLGEIDRNRELRTAPTLPAIARYTGVLYDAIGVASLDAAALAYLHHHVIIQSALFGPIMAGDHIPAYRLSYNSAVLGRGNTLRAFWSQLPETMFGNGHELVIDLRSKGYRELAPVPFSDRFLSVDVLTRERDGSLRALNHFNKKGKGELVRSLAREGVEFSTAHELLEGLLSTGHEVALADEHTLQLVVPGL